MDELINANYIADLKSIGRKDKLLSITCKAGDNIFINGSPKRCETHFEVLCGLRRPDVGEVKLCGKNPYEMNAKDAAAFRRDTIGAVPQDLGNDGFIIYPGQLHRQGDLVNHTQFRD